MTVYDPKDTALVFLRPGTKSRPIQMMDTLDKSGMLVDGKYAICMYTSKTGVNPPGIGKMDTIIASASDEYTALTIGGPKTTFRAPYPLDLGVVGNEGYVRASLTTAVTGSDLIVDITMNGLSMFSTQLRIDAGQKTSVGSATPAVLAITEVPDDAEFLVYLTQVGSAYGGSGLKVAVSGIKV